MSDNEKELEAQMESYNRNLLKVEVKKVYIDTGILDEELIEKYLQNGLDVKASGIETIKADVVFLEQSPPYGRELYSPIATFNPQIHINDEGYLTHAWFDMPDIHEDHIKKLKTSGHKIFMSPSTYRPFNPIKCFRCYIDGNEKRLLPCPLPDA